MTSFLVDYTLGKLAKWLRIMGYDTVLCECDRNRAFLEEGARERRIVLTRKKSLSKREYRGRLMIVEADKIEGQLEEVIRRLDLSPDPDLFFTRCLSCNAVLEPVERSVVEGRVPPYVYNTQRDFSICPNCGGLFWPGTHKENMEAFLRKHNPTGPP